MTAVFVVGIGGVFVFFMGWGAPSGRGPSTVIEVGPHRFGVREFERERARRDAQFQEAYGAEYDAEALQATVEGLAVNSLVERALLALEAQRLGLRASKPEIERIVLGSPIFRDESGRFDRDAYASWAEYEYGNERLFLRDQRMGLLATKMLRLLRESSRVSQAEARETTRRNLEEVRFTWVGLDARALPADFEVDDAQIQQTLAERGDEARRLYEELDELYDVPEQVRARHILLRVEPNADEARIAEVQQQAEAALERLRAGADFAEVAEEISEDPGTRRKGGDLGFFRRGQMVAPFEEVAFAIEPATLSGVVRTDYGFHILRVEEHRDAVNRPYAEVGEELALELLGREAARAAARATAERLIEAPRQGTRLADAARREGLVVERTGWLRRRAGGVVPKLGAAPELLAAVFTLEAGQAAPRVFEVGDKLVVAELRERKEPSAEEVEAKLAETRQELVQQRRNAEFEAWVGRRRNELLERGELAVNLQLVSR